MISVRTMTVADIPLGLRLARQAGWNQIESDWRRFLGIQPDGCFVGAWDGVPVATTAAFIFGPVAWIAMVLVEVESRRKGIATAMLKHALDFLNERDVKTIRLDATAAGQPVYEKLGFVPEYPLSRYMGTVPSWRGRPALASRGHPGLACPDEDAGLPNAELGVGNPVPPSNRGQDARDTQGQDALATTEPSPRPSALTLPPTASPQWKEIVAFDHRITATPREKMLARLFEESPDLTRVLYRDGQLQGYVTGRRGANATLIGPCIATGQGGPALLGEALRRCAGQPVFVDVPRDNTPAIEIVERSGLTTQRHFMRMCRGERIADHVPAIWASSGPEKG